MKKNCFFIRRLFVFSTFLMTFNVSAQPIFSKDLQKLIFKKSEIKRRVLIQFKANHFVEASDKEAVREVRFEQNLQRNALRFEQNFFDETHFDRVTTNPFSLWLARGLIVTLSTSQLRRLVGNESISQITSLNRTGHLVENKPTTAPALTANKFTYGLQKIKVPELLSIYPELTGQGTTVGIIDTGIDAQHPDLRGKVQIFRDFTKISNTTPVDDHGHGTHVAGTIAGGEASGHAIGIAPATKLIIAKTFTSSGSSLDENLLKSLQWMADPDGNSQTMDQPQIISNSWNLDESPYNDITPQDEPFCVVIESLSEMGIISVFAAGNDGSGSETIKTPASCPKAIAVGATDESDRLTEFSSRGPVRWKDQTLIKPEISAPGRDIDSADTGGGYRTRSGTSMAAPHISGLLALMLQVNFDLKLNLWPRFLLEGATDLGSPKQDNSYGFGRADILQSVYLMRQSAGLAHAGKIIGHDDFVAVAPDSHNIPEKFRPLVDAIGRTNYGCTVTHLGHGYALSAGHCFDATEKLERDQGCTYVKVRWGFRENLISSQESECEKIVALQNDQKEIDFAILKMKSYPLAAVSLKKDGPIYPAQMMTLFSHPNGQPLQWSQYCFVSGQHDPQVATGLLEYTCDTEGGSSGAVLIDAESAAVVGIHKGGFTETNYGTHLLRLPLIEILAELGF